MLSNPQLFFGHRTPDPPPGGGSGGEVVVQRGSAPPLCHRPPSGSTSPSRCGRRWARFAPEPLPSPARSPSQSRCPSPPTNVYSFILESIQIPQMYPLFSHAGISIMHAQLILHPPTHEVRILLKQSNLQSLSWPEATNSPFRSFLSNFSPDGSPPSRAIN